MDESIRKRKAPQGRGRPAVLLEQVPDAERGLPVDLVVGGFPGVQYPPHAFLPVSGDVLRLPLPFAYGPSLRRAFGSGRAHAELDYRHFSGKHDILTGRRYAYAVSIVLRILAAVVLHMIVQLISFDAKGFCDAR